MRDAGSSFRNASRSLFFFLFLFTLGYCRAEDIWGVGLPEARERLARGEALNMNELVFVKALFFEIINKVGGFHRRLFYHKKH